MLAHIAELKGYLESDEPMFPTSIIIAFNDSVRFEPMDTVANVSSCSRPGVFVIPVSANPEDEKPGWIVDGQQRIAAIREAKIDSFPVSVVGFIAKNDQEQREQFILVNSAKPLSKGLIYELLPSTEAKLPSLLRRRRFPAYILERLNHDHDSPLKGLIQTPTIPGGVIRDNSILRMLENSLTDGVLYRFRDPETGNGDVDKILEILKAFWAAVGQVFDDAWGLPPRLSRLMHGAGIITMGFVMDAISDQIQDEEVFRSVVFSQDLLPLKEACHWTEGYWELGLGNRRKWNEIQNTPKDIQLLANHVLTQYRELVWNLNRKEL